jgi:hypothetical protein
MGPPEPKSAWRSPREGLLAQLLAGVNQPMSKCAGLAGAYEGPRKVLPVAHEAQAEAEAALGSFS